MIYFFVSMRQKLVYKLENKYRGVFKEKSPRIWRSKSTKNRVENPRAGI
jgi:hypothetical protein